MPSDVLSALKAVGPALAAATAFEVSAKTFLGSNHLAGIVIPILSAAGLLFASSYIAVAKVNGQKHPTPEPKYALSLRVVAACGSILLLALFIHRLWAARPNALLGHAFETGYLCQASNGKPITRGQVIVLSRDGAAMSSPQDLDDRGFFYADLDKWAFLPSELRVIQIGCKSPSTISIDSGDADPCPASLDAATPSLRTLNWRLNCR